MITSTYLYINSGEMFEESRSLVWKYNYFLSILINPLLDGHSGYYIYDPAIADGA